MSGGAGAGRGLREEAGLRTAQGPVSSPCSDARPWLPGEDGPRSALTRASPGWRAHLSAAARRAWRAAFRAASAAEEEEDAPGSRGERCGGGGQATDPRVECAQVARGDPASASLSGSAGAREPGCGGGFSGASLSGVWPEVLCTGDCRSCLSSPTTCLRGEATQRLLPGRSPLPSPHF